MVAKMADLRHHYIVIHFSKLWLFKLSYIAAWASFACAIVAAFASTVVQPFVWPATVAFGALTTIMFIRFVISPDGRRGVEAANAFMKEHRHKMSLYDVFFSPAWGDVPLLVVNRAAMVLIFVSAGADNQGPFRLAVESAALSTMLLFLQFKPPRDELSANDHSDAPLN